VVWPCAAEAQNANLLSIMPPFLNESTLTLSVRADAGMAASIAPAPSIPMIAILLIAILPFPVFAPCTAADPIGRQCRFFFSVRT